MFTFLDQPDQRTPARRTLDRIAERARATDAEATRTISLAMRAMEQAFREAQQEFWHGPIPPEDLVAELGTAAATFFIESYTIAERLHAMGSTMFRQTDEQGNDTSRNEAGFLSLALPPRQIIYHGDGTVSLAP